MIIKWNETDIRRAKILDEKYSSTTIQANSKRWKTPSSWSNVMKVISNIETSESVDTTIKVEKPSNAKDLKQTPPKDHPSDAIVSALEFIATKALES